jgi:hypothetical protein
MKECPSGVRRSRYLVVRRAFGVRGHHGRLREVVRACCRTRQASVESLTWR